jgi:PIN domain nuclease of toxin-antitoxin system
MKYLLDTSVWIRAVRAPHELPAKIRALLNDETERFGLSVVSTWEVCRKHARGRLPLPMPLDQWMQVALAANIGLVDLTPAIAMEAHREPFLHDPFDGIIVATARLHGLTLVHSDHQLKGHPAVRSELYFKPRVKY